MHSTLRLRARIRRILSAQPRSWPPPTPRARSPTRRPRIPRRIPCEEITVTAQRREENARDVPISLTVFNAAEIEQQNFQGVESYFARHAERQLHLGRHARPQGIGAARHQRSALAGQQHQGRQLRILHRRVQRGAGHVQSRDRRHRSDRSAARPARHLLRPQCRRRRHQYHHQAADQRLLRRSERAVLELQHGRRATSSSICR